MRALTTGVAGFIGSNLAERFVADGHTVRGIDCFTSYYDTAIKRSNLSALMKNKRFEMVEADLCGVDIAGLLDGVDVVFHQAGQPGVRRSWAEDFGGYVDRNIMATQRLLEAAKRVGNVRIVYASSSSVYGNQPRYPVSENDLPRPRSPYGVSKLAAEQLCQLYAENFGVHVTSLRYFTVYGPRQRPDMALHRLIQGVLDDVPFPLYGSGDQVRDITYVGDVAAANIAASLADTAPGLVANIAGGSQVTLRSLIDMVGDELGTPAPIEQRDEVPGDVKRTDATVDIAHRVLGWSAKVDISEGLREQVSWHLNRQDLDQPMAAVGATVGGA